MALPFDDIAVVDYETYYDDEYTLKKMSTTDYIRDPRYKTQSASIHLLSQGTTRGVEGKDVGRVLKEIDWRRTAFLAHHAQFDGLITTHHYGVYPAFWLCSMSMARMALGVDQPVGLDALAKRLGIKGKEKAENLKKTAGKRDLSPEELAALLEYNIDDGDTTLQFWHYFRPFVPEEELKLIDLTIRMYAEPTLLIDGERVEALHKAEVDRKAAVFEAAGVDIKDLSSASKFAQRLMELGVTPPQKISAKTGRPTYAFAKNDLAFKELETHPDERVRTLVEARLLSKSTLVETRSAAILRRTGLPTPIYLNYYGARTGRWSGGDGVNWQNLPRRGNGAELRKSLVAPKGTMLVISDASQIEARLNAWDAGQDDVVEAFRIGEDVYCLNATGIYGYEVTPDMKDERFVGKVFTLGGGYGAGAPKINHMLKVGQFGPPVFQELEKTADDLRAWRAAMRYIVAKWKQNERIATHAFLNRTVVEDGPVTYEGTQRGGYMHGPNGSYVFYPNVFYSETERQMCYMSRNGLVRLYGGILTENRIQYLARLALGAQMVRMQEELECIRIATSTHDEVVVVAAEEDADYVAKRVNAIMSETPWWAPGLPLNADTKIAPIYNKS